LNNVPGIESRHLRVRSLTRQQEGPLPYQLVLSEPTGKKAKVVGENVFLNNLPVTSRVYLLYYSGAVVNRDLESRLRKFGKDTGTNLFVNIGKLNDPNYRKIVTKFAIKSLPVIIITGIDELASAKTEPSTAYVKLDSKNLLNSPDSLMDCVQKVFNLYIEGKVSKAMSQGGRTEFLSNLKRIVMIPLRGIKGFLEERDITVSLITGTFSLKRSGGKSDD
jgi:hypothetical protein